MEFFYFRLRFFIMGLCYAAVSVASPTAIETFGDSLTVGMLSNTNVAKVESPNIITKIYSDAAMYKMTKDKKYIAPYENPENGWPAYVASQVAKSTGSLPVYNYAISGKTSSDLVNQVGRARMTDPETLAFFFIGHNDLCNNENSPEAIAKQFVANYEAALEAWDKKHSGSQAYLVPVGDIPRVYETLKDYIWYPGKEANDGKAYRCVDSWWTYFPYCRSYYTKLEKGELKEFLEPRIEAMNNALEELASRWEKKGSKNRFKFLKDVHHDDYRPNYFAVDCFHLSREGQFMLGDKIFQAMGNTF